MDHRAKDSHIVEGHILLWGINCVLRVSVLLQLELPLLLPIPSHLSPQLMRTTVSMYIQTLFIMSIEIGYLWPHNDATLLAVHTVKSHDDPHGNKDKINNTHKKQTCVT